MTRRTNASRKTIRIIDAAAGAVFAPPHSAREAAAWLAVP